MSESPAPAPAPALTEIWIERDGARLFATDGGRGRPIVFLHGGLANHQSARGYTGALAQRFRLVTPDLRGSGRSIYAGALTWDQLADDVAALVERLGAGPAVIAGASFGAGVAIATALRHPRAVAGLGLFMPAYGGADVGFTPAQDAAMHAMDEAGARALAHGIEALLPIFDGLPPEVRDRVKAVARTYDPASVAASTRFMHSGAQPFASAAELAALTMPVLIVPGADPTHPPEIAEHLRRAIPHAIVRAAAAYDYAGVLGAFVDEAVAPVA